MHWWIASGVFNAIIMFCYFGISFIIIKGLYKTGKFKNNKLAILTSLIFFTCAVHHGIHPIHMLEHDAVGRATRIAMDWHSAIWDAFGAVVAMLYLKNRSNLEDIYNAQLYKDGWVAKQTSVLINECITQKLIAAKLYIEDERNDEALILISAAIEESKVIIFSVN